MRNDRELLGALDKAQDTSEHRRKRIAKLEGVLGRAESVLELASNGITWCAENSEDANKCDHEALNEIRKAISAIREVLGKDE